MKRIVTTASVAFTALVLAAVLAASASAETVLCSNPETPCQLNRIEPTGSYVVTGSAENYLGFRIEASGSTEFDCSANTMIAESKDSIGNPLPAEFYGNLANCRWGGNSSSPCSGSMNQPATTLEALTTDGLMKIGSAGKPLAFTFDCGTNATCTYSATNTVSLEIKEFEAKALAVPLALTSGSGVCSPSSPRLWVRNGKEGKYISKYSRTGTVICKTSEEPCDNKANQYGAGTSLEASPEGKVTFTSAIHTTECTSSALTGQITGAGGVGQHVPFEVTGFSLSGCNNNTTATVEGLPWKGTIMDAYGGGKAVFYVTNGVKIKFSRFGVVCYYGVNVLGQVQGSEILFESATLGVLPGSSFLCNEGATMSATYGITSPSPFFASWV